MKLLPPINLIILFLIPFILSQSAFAQEPTIDSQWVAVSKKHHYRGLYNATYSVNLINGNNAIKKVSAVVTSNTTDVEVIDGNVVFGDIAANKTAMSQDTVTIRLLHKHKLDPATQLSWKINYEPVQNIDIKTTPNNQVFNLNDSYNISTALNFVPPVNGTGYTVNVSQSISPSAGISVSPPINGASYNLSANFGTILSQTVGLSAEGEYITTTTATIAQTGQSSTSSVKVRVGSNIEAEIEVPQPGIYPEALAVNSTTSVLFSAHPAGNGINSISDVYIRDLDSAAIYPLFDNGENGDLSAHDFTYAKTYALNTGSMPSGSCFRFVAVVVVDNIETPSSKVEKLCVTKYPIGFQTITKEEIDQNGFTTPIGPSVSKDIINLKINTDAGEQQIDQIVASIGGVVIGANTYYGTYQVKLLTAPASLQDLMTLIHNVESDPNVLGADLTYFTNMLFSLTPTDPRFTEPPYLTQVRADEA